MSNTRLDSSGDERDSSNTLILTLIGPTGGLFLLSYLGDGDKIKEIVRTMNTC